MPEPEGTAEFVGEILPGVFRWKMHDNRIDAESDCYVVETGDEAVFIDPLPMAEDHLAEMGSATAIVLTASCHERASHRYSKLFGVEVWAPEGAVDFEDQPDRWYKEGDALPGGLVPIHSPGPTEAFYSLYLPREGGVVFCADLLINRGGGWLVFVPDEYQDAPELTRSSVRRLTEISFENLCPNHGEPLIGGAKEAIETALARDPDTVDTFP